MKVSIITVCRNEEKRIEKTLTSVKNQTYKNIEHLLIDGLSTDKTIEIIKKHKPHYFISEPDKGIYQAMNKGIVKSSGNLILFLNAGDYLAANDVIELAVNSFKSNTDIFFGKIFSFYENTNSFKLSKHLTLSKEFFIYGTLPHPATLFKRELFDEIGFLNEKFKIASDREFYVKAFMHKKTFQQSTIAMTYFELGGVSGVDITNGNHENSIIAKMYLKHYLGNNVDKYHQELDFISGFYRRKISLLKLSNFYDFITNTYHINENTIINKNTIRDNINLLTYNFERVNLSLLIHYIRYKIKRFFRGGV